MTTESIHDQLTRLPLLCAAVPEEVRHIAEQARLVNLGRNEILFSAGDKPDAFFCVKSGQVKLTVSTPGGAEKIIELMGPGQSFGEALLFLDQPSPVTVQALEKTTLVRIPGHVILQSIEGSPAFTRRILAGLSQRLHYLVADLEAYCLYSSSERVIGYLLGELQKSNPDEDTRTVNLPANKSVIASRLNLTPETFSRTLHHLVEEGAIEVSGKTITIRDVDSLRRCG